mmetsp:Transcript_28289/g.71681  ORF Transcript_28289/g.71681 Transcript_28289/m.71681 type:complete len:218 (-) Transcript_28289:10-663(-)
MAYGGWGERLVAHGGTRGLADGLVPTASALLPRQRWGCVDGGWVSNGARAAGRRRERLRRCRGEEEDGPQAQPRLREEAVRGPAGGAVALPLRLDDPEGLVCRCQGNRKGGPRPVWGGRQGAEAVVQRLLGDRLPNQARAPQGQGRPPQAKLQARNGQREDCRGAALAAGGGLPDQRCGELGAPPPPIHREQAAAHREAEQQACRGVRGGGRERGGS